MKKCGRVYGVSVEGMVKCVGREGRVTRGATMYSKFR